jgi:predicted AAA+ superfamily ATPase
MEGGALMQGLPIGIDDFAKVREGEYYFVDKSLAIRDFLDNHGEVLLLTRPRRFGKTLFLSMFYYRGRRIARSFAA